MESQPGNGHLVTVSAVYFKLSSATTLAALRSICVSPKISSLTSSAAAAAEGRPLCLPFAFPPLAKVPLPLAFVSAGDSVSNSLEAVTSPFADTLRCLAGVDDWRSLSPVGVAFADAGVPSTMVIQITR